MSKKLSHQLSKELLSEPTVLLENFHHSDERDAEIFELETQGSKINFAASSFRHFHRIESVEIHLCFSSHRQNFPLHLCACEKIKNFENHSKLLRRRVRGSSKANLKGCTR